MREMKDSGVAWIGEMPASWTVSKMKTLGEYINGYAFKPSDWTDNGLPIIRIQDLTGSHKEPNYFNGVIDSKYLISNGDILVSWAATLDAYLWGQGMAWLNQHIFKVIPNQEIICKDYFLWLLKAAMEHMNNDNKHGIMMQHVTLSVFNNFNVPVPSLNAQKTLSQIICSNTKKVDALITNQEQQIEKLKAYKQSLITEAVTKGLNPDAPMKDSGVEWIGNIPSHWNVKRIKNAFSLRNEKNYESDLSKVNLISLYTDKGVIQHSDIVETTGNKAVTAEGYKCVCKSDIVVNIILCWMGAIGMSNYDGVTSPAYDIYKPINNTNS